MLTVISGGQTGADRIAIEVARDLGFETRGTAIFCNLGSPGSRSTIRFCATNHKPYIANPNAASLVRFIRSHRIGVLNVTGNRASRLTPQQTATIHSVLKAAFRTVRSFSSSQYRKL